MSIPSARSNPTVRRLLPAFLILAAVAAMAGVPASAQGTSGERLRLVLDDTSIDVIGPVIRDGALLTFRTADGRLGSIQARRVARVVSLTTGRSAPPPAAEPARARAVPGSLPAGRAGRFSNDDLPDGGAPDGGALGNDDLSEFAGTSGALTNDDLASDAVAPVVSPATAWTNADLPPGAEPPRTPATPAGAQDVIEPGDPARADPDATATAGAAARTALEQVLAGLEPASAGVTAASRPADALDPLSVEAELAALDEQIAAAERERNTYYRLMVCVQHGVSPRSADCTPRLRPKPSLAPSLSERSLAAKVADAKTRADDARAERAVLVERARAAGIRIQPTENR